MQRHKPIVNQIKKLGLRAISPAYGITHRCSLCLQSATWPDPMCYYCFNRFSWNRHACLECSHPLDDKLLTCSIEHGNPWQRAYSAVLYEYPVPQLLNKLKLNHQRKIALPIAKVLEEYLKVHRQGSLPQQLIPIPSRPSALAQRGFNPVEAIANELSVKYRKLLATNIISAEESLESKQLTKEQRSAASLFKIHRRPAKSVALIDDVMTTGSTLAHAAQLLKRHGTESIEVWTFARTPEQRYYDIAIIND